MDPATRYIIPLVLLATTGAAAAIPAFHTALWAALPLPAIALWDFLQSRHTLRRNYPLLARLRWLSEDLRPLCSFLFRGRRS